MIEWKGLELPPINLWNVHKKLSSRGEATPTAKQMS